MWKPVPNYEDMYEASVNGEVRNIKSKRLLKPYGFRLNSRGNQPHRYYRVKLYSSGGKSCKTFLLHRVIANTHLYKPLNKPEVNHIDGDRTNNAVENLEWCDRSENLRHAVKMGLIDMTKMTDVTKKKVVQLTLSGKIIREWDSLSSAARETGLQVSNISHCCSGRINQTGGFKWKRLGY